MMKCRKPGIPTVRFFIFTLMVVCLLIPGRVLATDGSERVEIIEITYTEYTWQLSNLEDKSRVCEVKVDHPDQPTGAEIYYQCGHTIYYQWLETSSCFEDPEGSTEECSGISIYLLKLDEITKEIVLDLPIPTVRLDLNNCDPVPGTGLCSSKPSLLITAEEPLPNEEISHIRGMIEDESFFCAGGSCEVALEETSESGAALEFWAGSSYGDTTDTFVGQILVIKTAIEETEKAGWQVEIVSGFDGLENLEGCAEIWGSYPPLGTTPDWLSNPSQTMLLKTNEPYGYLAGQMIQKGYVDTSHCEDLGLSGDGYASQCGLEASRFQIGLWQNNFDRHIIQAAEDTGIPASLLKRIFARESQFWPETTDDLYREYGFGHITELGADTTLLWNRDFYDQFCPLVLEVGKCQLGYAELDEWSQATLRGALLLEMEIILSEDNVYDIDHNQMEESVSLFSETLLGNCAQVGQMIAYRTDQIPGEIVSYEDLWRFTLVNFQAGPGCMANAINDVHKNKAALVWDNISASLLENCPWTVAYVEDIAK